MKWNGLLCLEWMIRPCSHRARVNVWATLSSAAHMRPARVCLLGVNTTEDTTSYLAEARVCVCVCVCNKKQWYAHVQF